MRLLRRNTTIRPTYFADALGGAFDAAHPELVAELETDYPGCLRPNIIMETARWPRKSGS